MAIKVQALPTEWALPRRPRHVARDDDDSASVIRLVRPRRSGPRPRYQEMTLAELCAIILNS